MTSKYFLYIFASFNFLEGLLGLYCGQYYFRGWKDVSQFEAIMLISSSIILLYFAYKLPKDKFKPQKDILVSICPNCEKTYYYKNLKNGLCPKCNIQTITIEKYNKQVKKYNKKQKQKESSTKRNIKENPNKRLNLENLNIKDIKIKKE